MWRRYTWNLALLTSFVLGIIGRPAIGAGHGHSGHASSHGQATSRGGPGPGPSRGQYNFGGGSGGYGYGNGYGGGLGYGLGGYYGYYSPVIVVPPPQILFQPTIQMFAPGASQQGVLAGPMPVAGNRPAVPVVKAKRVESPKGTQLVTIGDRLFRAGNTKRAAERYEQAARINPDSAAPHVRLAQVAMVRGQYAEAADQLRRAISAEPEWLANAHDIQGIFGEPADFRKQLAKLESHLLVEPGDRDGWLVLGAELFLSGQTRRAGDVFLRLTDRRPDATLSLFLDASVPPDRFEN